MINRVFKAIFIMTLCLGITLPSNAAGVSVSDGSAFITKSEMAYKLNNLSKRMTELENSMDSRIDKLVSSYLTRNGVWNGTKQTLTAAVRNNRKYSFISDWGSGDMGTQFVTKVHFDDRIVQGVSKTGLVFGKFGYGNEHVGSPNDWYYGGFANGFMSGDPGWIWDQNAVITLSFYMTEPGSTTSTSGELKTKIRIGETLGIWNWKGNIWGGNPTEILMAIPIPRWNIVPFVFFVDKGKDLWWRWTDEVSFFRTVGWNTASNAGSAMKVILYELSVY